MESIGTQPTSRGSGTSTPDDRSVGDTLSEQDEGTVTPPSKQTTPVTSPHSSFRYHRDTSRELPWQVEPGN